jgi:putative ABC transport system permease protein
MQMHTNASFGEAIQVALHSLRSSKLRTFLTLLGIILATTTLIAVMAVINGMNRYIAENVSDMGADGFRVLRMAFVGNWDPKKYLEFEKKNPQLKVEEYRFIKEKAALVREIGMQTSRGVTVKCGNESMQDVRLQGVTPNLGAISNTQTDIGRFLTDPEDAKRLSVAFIGVDIKNRCFANVDPLGKSIDVNDRPFQIIGVARSQGSVFGQSRDNFVMIPVQTFFKSYGSRTGISYMAQALSRDRLFQAQDEIRMLLRAFRGMGPAEDDNFAILSSDALVSAWDQMTGAIAASAVAVVSVFMVVGGVVIMNIMLAVVTERTHEIGIRKAIGARQQDILNQYLVESSVLAGTGGLIGVILAWLVTLLVRAFTPVPIDIPLSAVLVGITLSMVVGLFFGIYPARRASRLDPIEALRVER